jgi:hypothetical protein
MGTESRIAAVSASSWAPATTATLLRRCWIEMATAVQKGQ